MKALTYQERTIIAAAQLTLPQGTVTHLSIAHDLDCPMLHGKKVCRCVPDMSIKTPSGAFIIEADGSLTNQSTQN